VAHGVRHTTGAGFCSVRTGGVRHATFDGVRHLPTNGVRNLAVTNLRHHRCAADAFFHSAGDPAFAADLTTPVLAATVRSAFATATGAAVAVGTAGGDCFGVGFPATTLAVHHPRGGDRLHDGVARIFVARLRFRAVLRDTFFTIAGLVNRLADAIAHIAIAGLVDGRTDVVAHIAIARLVARPLDVARHRLVAGRRHRTTHLRLHAAIVRLVDRLAHRVALVTVACLVDISRDRDRHTLGAAVVNCCHAGVLLLIHDNFADGTIARHTS